MKEPIANDFSALIGIDWADKKHHVCELPTGTKNTRILLYPVNLSLSMTGLYP